MTTLPATGMRITFVEEHQPRTSLQQLGRSGNNMIGVMQDSFKLPVLSYRGPLGSCSSGTTTMCVLCPTLCLNTQLESNSKVTDMK